MQYATIVLEERDDIVVLTLNRPDKLNALNEAMARELLDVFSKVAANPAVRVFVITGAGNAFSAGADVKEVFGQWFADGGERLDWFVMGDWAEQACLALASVEAPTVAVINGPAVGFGCTLALACDIRVASDKASMGMVFSRVGYMPEFGSTFFLPRVVGLGKAIELVLTGKVIGAAEAREIGLVNSVVPSSELTSTTEKLVGAIARQAPVTLRLAKRAMRQGLVSTLPDQLYMEKLATRAATRTLDFREGIAAFLAKRDPTFQGR